MLQNQEGEKYIRIIILNEDSDWAYKVLKELEDRISALKSLEDSMLGKGFDKKTLEEAVRSKGTLGLVAREVDEEMRTRSSEIVQRRFVVSSEIRELEKKMRRNG